jgi:probable O-glycosylation ligase (exosortase A-associated)
MRDLVILAVLPFMLYAMCKRPFIGLGLWIWTALFFPNGWLYGIASNIRFNLLFAGITVIGYCVWKHKPRFRLTATGGLVLLFFAWATASTIMGIGDPERAWDFWGRLLKTILLFGFVLAIIENKLHVDFFLWCCVLSVGFFADLEALKYLASGGSHMIEGMYGHVLYDRNELSIAFLMTLPICVYLLQEYGKRSKLLSMALLGTIALMLVAVIGTQSRGGFVVLVALGVYFYLKSERKGLLTVLLVLVVVGMAQLVTDEWVARIQTVNAADKDASFMGRVVAWKLSFILAMQHPFFGGGFKALETFRVWSMLSQDFGSLPWFYTGDAVPDRDKVHAAHSVYFQLMGDHGFFGLGIYISFLVAGFLKARNIVKIARRHAVPDWIPRLATALQLTMFAFCLGGSSLSFAYFEMIYAVIGLLIVLETRILPAAILALGKETESQQASLSLPADLDKALGQPAHALN